MGKTLIEIGAADRGRAMSLAEFEHARLLPGLEFSIGDVFRAAGLM